MIAQQLVFLVLSRCSQVDNQDKIDNHTCGFSYCVFIKDGKIMNIHTELFTLEFKKMMVFYGGKILKEQHPEQNTRKWIST